MPGNFYEDHMSRKANSNNSIPPVEKTEVEPDFEANENIDFLKRLELQSKVIQKILQQNNTQIEEDHNQEPSN